MGDLSKNLSRREFVCRCGQCTDDPVVDSELVSIIQDVVDHFSEELKQELSVSINSGNRCDRWNAYTWGCINTQKKLKGESVDIAKIPWDSYHLKGMAADIVIRGVGADLVYNYLDKKYPADMGIGKYPDRTHIDVRKGKARWVG